MLGWAGEGEAKFCRIADAPVLDRPSHHLLPVTAEGKISVLSQVRTSKPQEKWATWQQRSLPFSWPYRDGSLCRPPCLQTTGRCPLWTGRSSPQLPSGPTYGKHVWLIPPVCPTARTFLQCWLWMVSSEMTVAVVAVAVNDVVFLRSETEIYLSLCMFLRYCTSAAIHLT